ncbi:hypothetical protein AHMF7605_23570 [Adhaeribacter arboris]|uniref:Uncharacterized protein n=1 Tax=Adhaeribacter arboris TaxID=2072846 RepID=A0A2T2YL73_9BACT|nr:hypothetical protein AHMF7605_23570 [Adhaeribacter arboris]
MIYFHYCSRHGATHIVLLGAGSRLQAAVLMRWSRNPFASWPAGLVWLFRAGLSFLSSWRRNACGTGTLEGPPPPNWGQFFLVTVFIISPLFNFLI